MTDSQTDGRTSLRVPEGLNDHDPDAVDGFVAVDYINHNASWKTEVKPTRLLVELFTAFQYQSDNDDLVVAEIALSAIHLPSTHAVPSTVCCDGERDRDAFHRHLADRERRVRSTGRAQLPRALPADRHDSAFGLGDAESATDSSARCHCDVRACGGSSTHGCIFGDRLRPPWPWWTTGPWCHHGPVHGSGPEAARASVAGIAPLSRELRWSPGPAPGRDDRRNHRGGRTGSWVLTFRNGHRPRRPSRWRVDVKTRSERHAGRRPTPRPLVQARSARQAPQATQEPPTVLRARLYHLPRTASHGALTSASSSPVHQPGAELFGRAG